MVDPIALSIYWEGVNQMEPDPLKCAEIGWEAEDTREFQLFIWKIFFFRMEVL